MLIWRKKLHCIRLLLYNVFLTQPYYTRRTLARYVFLLTDYLCSENYIYTNHSESAQNESVGEKEREEREKELSSR